MRALLTTVMAAGMLLTATAAVAEHDSFGLGDGSDGDLMISVSEINDYAQVIQPLAPGDTLVTVSNATKFSGPRGGTDSGDLIMVLQATGIVPFATSGNPSSVDLSFDAVGRWELARVASKSGNVLTLTAPLIHSYAASVTQIIRVPEYGSPIIATNIHAKEWDGTSGGVVAFLATGTVTLIGSIDASGRGFQGGDYAQDNRNYSTVTCPSPSALDVVNPQGAQKGEGIDSSQYVSNRSGRGNMANGGGGGMCIKTAGGGGGHAGGGGKGGKAPSTSTSDNGGMGGAALVYSLLDHLTFGGGGGSGHGSTNHGSKDGGRGGGIIFIRADIITGGGVGSSISASGEAGGTPPSNANGDGAGGGGAGGSIVLRVANSLDCGITLNATGGPGGSNSEANSAPGGGGGGGRILYQAGSLSSGCQRNVDGGAAGTTNNGNSTQGATAGQPGIVSSLPGGFKHAPPTLAAPTGTIGTSKPMISGGSAPPGARILIFLDGVEVGSTFANASGNFGLQPNLELRDGSHSAQAAMEYQGVRSQKSNTITFTVDTVPPAAPKVTHLGTLSAASGISIQNPSPTIQGSTEVGSSVDVYIDGVGGPWAANVIGGVWDLNLSNLSIALQERLPPATPYNLRVVAKDAFSRPSETFEFGFYVDLSNPNAPTVVTVADRSPILNNQNSRLEVWATTQRLLIKGSAESNAKVTVVLGSQPAGTTRADNTGNWSMLLNPVNFDGTYTLTVTATDASDRVSASTQVDVHVDSSPPDTIIEEKPGSFGDSSIATFTFKSLAADVVGYVCLIGKKCENATSTTIEEVSECGTKSASSGVYEYSFNVVCDGDFNLLVRAKDQAGNLDPWPDSHSWSVKTGQFVAIIKTGPGPKPSRLSRSVFQFESNRPTVKSYECDLKDLENNKIIYEDESCRKSNVPCLEDQGCYDLPDGLYSLSVTALDISDARSLSVDQSERTWRVDTDPPAKPVVQSPGDDAFLKESSLLLKGTATAGYLGEELFVRIDIDDDGTSKSVSVSPQGGWEQSVPLADGVHILRIWVQDKAENSSSEVRRKVTIDTVPPDVGIVSAMTPSGEPLPHSTQSSEAHFGFETDELADTFERFECRLDGAAYAPCATTDHRISGLPEGLHALEVRARDKAQNVSPTAAKHEWIVDRTPPETIIESGPKASVRPDTVSFVFSVSNTEHGLVTYQCSLDDAPFRACTSPLSLPVLAEGEHSLQIKARDEAGLEDSTPMVWSWTVDSRSSMRATGGGLSCSASGGGGGALLAVLGMVVGTMIRSTRRRRHRAERNASNSSYT